MVLLALLALRLGSSGGSWNHRVSAFLIGFLLLGGILPHSAALPISHAEITLDGSLGPQGPLTGPNYVIGHDLGQIRGSNLFHSFGQFNVLKGESATFTGPNTIENILGRVTGGQQSFIDGLLRSTIPGANLFLLNPSGVLFGPTGSPIPTGIFATTRSTGHGGTIHLTSKSLEMTHAQIWGEQMVLGTREASRWRPAAWS